MAYRALYRTYRPKLFSEVVGQKAVIKTLTNALKDGKIAHAYLFCGPRGTGKTSMARLFAKALNCSEGVGHECNKCENCRAVLDGQHPDVFEIDAASNSGVDNVRKLIEQVSFAPILGRYKVYIIDEVHSMSSSAFNALLKTLEEPPANVVFILATTEPDKVLPTILSRVQRFDFSKVSEADLVLNMKNILAQEKVRYDEQALYTIARLSQGGVRDSLSLLDQAISYSGNNITEENINTIFGLLEVTDEIELVKMIHLNDIKGCLSLLKDKYQKGADILRLHNDLINIYKDLLIFGTTKDASLLNFLTSAEAMKILVTPTEIRRNLDILIASRREYKNSLNTFDQLELTIIELASNDASFSKPFEKPEVRINNPLKAESEDISDTADKPVIKADGTKAPEAKKEEKSAEIITSSTLEKYNDIIDDGNELKFNEEDIINVMVQGNKHAKGDLLEIWEPKLNALSSSADPAKAYMASNLLRSTPVIFASGLIVIDTNFKGIARKVNLISNLDKNKQFIKDTFELDAKVVAVYHPDYIDYVKDFLSRSQAKTLPKAKPISFINPPVIEKPEEERKPTNAEMFINSLKGE